MLNWDISSLENSVYPDQLASQKPADQDIHCCHFVNGPRREKTCLRGFANNTGANQPAHLRSLISAFVIRLLESTLCKLNTSEISIR